jgi:PAS domain S-box-containing protein
MRDQAEDNFAALLETSDDFIWSLDSDDCLLTFNRAFERFIQYTLGVRVSVGMRLEKISPSETASTLPALYQRVRAEGSFHVKYPLADKQVMELILSPIFANGEKVGISVVGSDISKRMPEPSDGAENADRFRNMFEENGSVMLLIDPCNGEIDNANPAASAYYGYAIDRLIGMNMSQINSLSPEELTLALRHALSGERSFFPFRHLLASGEERYVDAYVSAVDVNNTTLLFSVIHDVTEQKRAEKSLQRTLSALQEAQEIGELGSYALDIPSGMWSSSVVLNEIFGISEDYVRSVEGWVALIHPEHRAMMSAYFAGAVLGERRDFDKEYCITRQADGSKRWVHGKGRLEYDEQGNLTEMHGVIRDITERKKQDIQLRESEERYRIAFQTSLDSININRMSDGVYVECNESFLEIFGFNRDEVIGRTSLELNVWANPLDRQKLVADLGRSRSFRDWEVQFRRRNGEVFWGTMSASVIELDGVSCILSVGRDISESKAAAQRLAASQEAQRVSEERYRTAFQLSLDSISLNRLDNGEYVEVNEAFLRVTGYSREEVVGKTAEELAFWANPSQWQEQVAWLRQHRNCRDQEILFRRKNQQAFWGLISASVIEIEDVPCILAVMRDISNAKEAAQKIQDLAFYDPLTRLPNRRLLLNRLGIEITSGVRRNQKRALLLVDLDNFKALNDTLGQEIGDLLLQEVARRLAACIRQEDTVARLGSDEFVLMLEDLSGDPGEAAVISSSG